MSVDSLDNCLENLKCLRGRPLTLCLLVLNKDLTAIQVRAAEDVEWLGRIFAEDRGKWKPLLIKRLTPIGVKSFLFRDSHDLQNVICQCAPSAKRSQRQPCRETSEFPRTH